MNTDISNINTQKMSSLEIAKLTGKAHGNVIRDIRAMLPLIDIDMTDFREVLDNRRYTKYFILPQAFAKKLLARYKKIGIARKEKERIALDTIEQVLNIKLIRQFHILSFFIDGYDIDNRIAYEIDEEHHKRQKVSDLQRQDIIEKTLNCTFVRIKV